MNGVIRVKRKVGRMGNSLGVSLPKKLADKLKVKQGDEIEFVEKASGEILLKKVRNVKIPDNVRPEVLETFYDVFEEDRGILDDLRDR
jgi:antitoxin MazE